MRRQQHAWKNHPSQWLNAVTRCDASYVTVPGTARFSVPQSRLINKYSSPLWASCWHVQRDHSSGISGQVSSRHKPNDLSTSIDSCRQYPHSEDATCNASNYQQGLTAVRHHLRVAPSCRNGNNTTSLQDVDEACRPSLRRLLTSLHVEVHICVSSYLIQWNPQCALD